MVWASVVGCQSPRGQMPVPCPTTPFVSSSSVWRDPGGSLGLSLPSELTGTPCPSPAEAAGGLGWRQPYGVQVLSFTHRPPFLSFLPGQETLLAAPACPQLCSLALPQASLPADPSAVPSRFGRAPAPPRRWLGPPHGTTAGPGSVWGCHWAQHRVHQNSAALPSAVGICQSWRGLWGTGGCGALGAAPAQRLLAPAFLNPSGGRSPMGSASLYHSRDQIPVSSASQRGDQVPVSATSCIPAVTSWPSIPNTPVPSLTQRPSGDQSPTNPVPQWRPNPHGPSTPTGTSALLALAVL